jgi:hypothetical protein
MNKKQNMVVKTHTRWMTAKEYINHIVNRLPETKFNNTFTEKYIIATRKHNYFD